MKNKNRKKGLSYIKKAKYSQLELDQCQTYTAEIKPNDVQIHYNITEMTPFCLLGYSSWIFEVCNDRSLREAGPRVSAEERNEDGGLALLCLVGTVNYYHLKT